MNKRENQSTGLRAGRDGMQEEKGRKEEEGDGLFDEGRKREGGEEGRSELTSTSTPSPVLLPLLIRSSQSEATTAIG